MTKETVYNFRNYAELYDAAIELHGKENMKNKETWIYNLNSIDVIENIKKSGEFIVLKRNSGIIGIIAYKKGTEFISLDGNIKKLPNEWEICSLLVHRRHRHHHHARHLFESAIKRLREKQIYQAYMIVTGTFDENKKGETREMCKHAEDLCRSFDGHVVGFGKYSHGPVYKITID